MHADNEQPHDAQDRVIKVLLKDTSEAVLRRFLNLDVHLQNKLPTEHIKVKAITKKLSDMVFLATMQGKKACVHIEIQNTPNKNMYRRMLAYGLAIMEEHDLPLFQILIYAGRRKARFRNYINHDFGIYRWLYHFPVLDLGSISRQELLALGEPDLLPLLPLCERESRRQSPEAFIRECLDMLLEQVRFQNSSLEVKNTLLLRMQILAGSVTDPSWAKKIFDEVMQMFLLEENWVYKEIVEKGIEKGVEKGAINSLRSAIEDVLRLRFGALPAEVTAELEKESTKQKLKYLLERAVLAASLEEFKGALFSV